MIKINDIIYPVRSALEALDALDAISQEMNKAITRKQEQHALMQTAMRLRRLAADMDKLRETFTYK